VRTISSTGEKSDFSNQVSIIPGTPPAAPERLSVTGRTDGVLVEWSGTDGATGYNIYRRGAEERSLGQPIHAAAAEERSWVDTSARMGQGYIYGVTAMAGQDPLIESGIASEQEIRFQDRFPPPPPLELVALAEAPAASVKTGRVRLIWRGSEAEDLAGYHVYRRGAEGDFVRITTQPLQETEYIDASASAGQTYSYRVTAVDQIGNESGPGAEVRASVPQ
jgi:fibronectin type 3 domain-containing protein